MTVARIKGWAITRILLSAAALALAGCGGGGGGSTGSAPAAASTYSISGTVTGGAVSGVKITVSGPTSASVLTDATGKYTIGGLANGAYTVVPSYAGNAFNPVSAAVNVSGANVTQNFSGIVAATTYSLSGAVTLGSAGGGGVAGVTVTLGGANGGTAVTDANGMYTFSGLVGGTYTLTPGATPYAFTPASLTGTVANLSGLNFTAAVALPTYSISGTVSGNVSGGVTMTLTGAANATTVTASNGTYTFPGLANGTYTVTPSAAGNTFTPGSILVTVNNASITVANFSSTAIATGIAPITIAGTVTGAWVDQIPLTISGGGGTVSTNSSGNYSSASLPGGVSYTITPSLPGYTFTPASVSTNITTSAANFVATPVVPSYSISGTVTYAGAQNGRVYVNSCCSIPTAGTIVYLKAGSGAFTLRGVGAGSYTVSAQMDTLGNGAFNAANASGVAATAVTVTNANVTGVAVTLADPASVTPAAPTALTAVGGDRAALISWVPPALMGPETDIAYKIYWGTDAAASNGTPVKVAAHGMPITGGGSYLLPGLTNGTKYYFKISGLAGVTESAPSTVIGPVTIGAPAGLNTVSGTVAFSGTVPMLAVELNCYTTPATIGAPSILTTLFQRIANPVSPQPYSISGVASGDICIVNAFLDLNNDGIPDAGDISNISSSADPAPGALVNGNTTVNLTLWAINSSSILTTSNVATLPSLLSNYTETYGLWGSYKTPVAATLVSAPNLPVPFDLGTFSGSMFFGSANLATVAPKMGDVFKVLVTYSDGTSEYLNKPVSGVLNLAQNLAPNSLTAAGQTVPTFSWTAPVNAPANYVYTLTVAPTALGMPVWYSPGIPSTQTSVLYNANGTASQPSLTAGTSYTWNLLVSDQYGNSSQTQAQYTP